jgi:hypothetical protein
MVRRLAVRLGVPAFPGTTLTFTGQVVGTAQAGGDGLVDVALRGATGSGDHVTGTATLSLPL